MGTLSRSRTSLLAQFRFGLLPLENETDRDVRPENDDIDVEKNRKIHPSERVCKLYVTMENVKMKYILCVYVLYIMTYIR